MNRQLMFLSGHLSGLLLGAALVWAYYSNAPTRKVNAGNLPRNQVVIPVRYPTVPPLPRFQPTPKGWELRHFNGQPYYIIPVDNVPEMG